MEITINFINDSKVILNPVGDVNFSTSKILKDALDKVFNDDYKEIIIDFSEIKNIDSEGLGRLLLFHKKLKDNEGELIIRNIENDHIKKLFKTINLNQVIKIEE